MSGRNKYRDDAEAAITGLLIKASIAEAEVILFYVTLDVKEAQIAELQEILRGVTLHGTKHAAMQEKIEELECHLKVRETIQLAHDLLLQKIERLEAQLRLWMFRSHSCQGKYGDDGEMQCNRAPLIDFKRDSLENIEQKNVHHVAAVLSSIATLEAQLVRAVGGLELIASYLHCPHDTTQTCGRRVCAITHEVLTSLRTGENKCIFKESL